MLCPQIGKLQTKLQDKKDELHKALFDLSETQKNCKQLQDLTSEILTIFQHKTRYYVDIVVSLVKLK